MSTTLFSSSSAVLRRRGPFQEVCCIDPHDGGGERAGIRSGDKAINIPTKIVIGASFLDKS